MSDTETRAADAPRDTCFIMMQFGGYFDQRFEKIYKPAVEAAGLNWLRADNIFKPTSIMSDVWMSIQSSGLLLADMTNRNPNVFYELGLAHALGKPVVLVSQTLDDVPFDLQPYRTIPFDPNMPGWDVKLRDDITKSLTETMEDPIGAVPEMFRELVSSQAPKQDEIHARLDHIEGQLRLLEAKKFVANRKVFLGGGNYLVEGKGLMGFTSTDDETDGEAT